MFLINEIELLMFFSELQLLDVFKYDGILLQKRDAKHALNIHFPDNGRRKLYYISLLADLGDNPTDLVIHD